MIRIVHHGGPTVPGGMRYVVADQAPSIIERLCLRRIQATAYDDGELVGAVVKHPDPQTYHNGRRWVTFRWTWYCWNYNSPEGGEVRRHPSSP